MEISLIGRRALVTGSSRGIGFEIAKTLGLAGAKVALCARNRNELRAALRRLEESNIECLGITVDLERAGSEKKTLRAVVESWDGLDILVNNVGGIAQTGNFDQLSDAAWNGCFLLNLMPTVRFCRAAIPHLQLSKHARIINISSMVATQPGRMNPHYSAFKAAVLNLTKHLSGAYAKDKILVNSISPGIIHTEGWDEYIRTKAAREGISLKKCRASENRRAIKNVPLHRLGHGSEVAALAAFLASDHSAFITGTNHRVDGGRVQSVN